MGVSDKFYANLQAFPIYGTGQGSGNSPAIWFIVCCVLFACHAEKGHGAYFCTPDQQMSVSLSKVGFVDDSTGFKLNSQPTPEFLQKIMKRDTQLWSDLLWLFGGLLEIKKCSFHQIQSKYQPNHSLCGNTDWWMRFYTSIPSPRRGSDHPVPHSPAYSDDGGRPPLCGGGMSSITHRN
jgi:hypothetical protein